jgi:hypothetical protein
MGWARYCNTIHNEGDIMTRLSKTIVLVLILTGLAGCCILPPGPHNNWGRGDGDRHEHHHDRY